jgi:hypothetical protein
MKVLKASLDQANENADKINRKIRNALIDSGYRGIIPAPKARTIVKKVLAKLNIKTHKISIEPHPIHKVGSNEMYCNCDRSIIKVESLN